MKFLILPLLFTLNSAWAFPQIEKIEGAAAYDLNGGVRIFTSFAPPCSENLAVCNPLGLQGPEAVRLFFKDDVSQIRVSNLQGLSIPITKSATARVLEFTWDDLCLNTQMAEFCAAASPFRRIGLRAFVDANSNGLWDAMEEAIAIEVHILNPSPEFYSVAGDMNTEGIREFSAAPGQGRALIENVSAETSFPRLSYNAHAVKVRVYASDRGLSTANSVEANVIAELPLDSSGNLTQNAVEGLINGTTYVIRLALIDEAGNVVLNFPGDNADATCDAGTPFVGCPWAVTPGN